MSGEHPCRSYRTTPGCHKWLQAASSPSPPASKDEDDDVDADVASSSSTDEMST